MALLQACSAIKLGYGQAPNLAYWWLDGYIDFNSHQSPRVRDELTRLFAWHRSNELPKYASLVQKAQALLPREVNAAQVCALYEQSRTLVNQVTDKVQPVVATLAGTLGAEQVDFLAAKYAKNNEEYQRDYVKGSAEKRSVKRLKQAIERSEMVYGKLEEPQIAAIQKSIAQSSFDANIWSKERERRQQDLLQVLRTIVADRSDVQTVQNLLRGYLSRSTASPDAAYRAYAEKMAKESCASFAAVHATTTLAQRDNAVMILQGYAADLLTLAVQK